MAIRIKSKNISVDIENEVGKVMGKIVFNPEDIGAYNALMEISEYICKIDDKYKETGKIEEIPEGKLEKVEDFQKARETFKKIADFTSFTVEQIDKVAEKLDQIFGKGTSELVLQGSHDMEPIAQFIEGVTPYFQDAQKKRVSKHLDDKPSDVM